MSLFYNPKKREVQYWTIIILAIIPLLLIFVLWLSTRKKVNEHRALEIQEEKRDIFDANAN